MTTANYSLILTSNQNEVSKVEQWVEKCAVEQHLSDDLHGTLAIVITELVNNAIVHGNECQPKKMVELNISVEPDQIKVSVEDEGQGFEPKGVPDPLADSNLEKAGGRGIFIVEHMMDETIHRKTNKGHIVETRIVRSK